MSSEKRVFTDCYMHPLLDCRMPKTLKELMLPKTEVSYLCGEKLRGETKIFQEMAVHVYGN